MTTRLVLICAAHDGSGGFPADRPAAPRLLVGAARLALAVPPGTGVFLAPGRAAADTARAAGIKGGLAPALAEADAGDWAGLTIEDVAARAPAALAAWIAQGAAPPGGESPATQRTRVAAWMTDRAAAGGTAVAIAPASAIRAAILAALDLPLAAARQIDIPALSVVRLTHDGHRWAWRAGD